MYAELHTRSAFSFLEGASLPEDLIAQAAALDYEAIALLDRDGVYGAPRFHAAAKKAKIRAHVGAEITSADGSRYPLLVASRAGYQNLCRLVTRMKLRAPKGEGAATEDDLVEFAGGLVCLAGAEEPVSKIENRKSKLETQISSFESRLNRLCGIFGRDNVYVELQRHFDRHEEAHNQAALEAARALRLPVIATNGVRYAAPGARELADVFTALRHYRTLDTAGRLLDSNAERHLKSPQEMSRLFADVPGAVANTLELSARLDFTLQDLGYVFPQYPVPEGETQNSFLRRLAYDGMLNRYGGGNERARRQIEHELAVIEKLDLAGYFLIVWDIVRFCREQSILVQGRGSAANSAVCYALGITAVDAVGMELLFERFLSEERGEWPDIDLDLPSGDQRERAIQYVYQRYGERGAAMTANVITYRGRSAAREAGKVLGFDAETLGRLTRLVSAWEYHDASETLERHFRDAGFDLAQPRIRKFLEITRALQGLPRHLGQHSGGLVICQGHLDAVVPVEPATMPGRVVVQWDKDDCADLGIVKVDLLGLGMMAVLEDSLKLIRDHYREEVDLAHLPADDPEVYAALQKADTVGLFQVESRAQMSCLPRLHPEHFYDIVVEVAIIRPGPIVGNMVHPYLRRRQGREPVTYPHPSLEPVLRRTMGVPLFQEQLLRLAMIAAGFTGGEAEELRRAMGFKRSELRMKEIEKKLRAGMERNGIRPVAQEEIVKSITSFALYGFPESHAASFALIAYASAYLRCHYLAAFTAALLNNQPMGFYHPSTIIKDAGRHGLRVKPIDVARSDWPCTLEFDDSEGEVKAFTTESTEGTESFLSVDSATSVVKFASRASQNPWMSSLGSSAKRIALRLGLSYVKGLREAAAQALVSERLRAPFTSLDDLVRRVPEMRKDEWVTLAEVGALNFVAGPESNAASDDARLASTIPEIRRAVQHRHRRDALWQVERAARPVGPLLEEVNSRQSTVDSLSSELETQSPAEVESRRSMMKNRQSKIDNSPLRRMTSEERLVADFRGTGLTVGPHPLAYRRAELDKLGVKPAVALAGLPGGRRVRVAGAVIVRQRPGTAKGFVFLSMEDETGIANAILTPDVFEQHRVLILRERFLLVDGILQNQDGVISVKAELLFPLTISRAAISSHNFY
jgi:error-prone DNA polymerase